MALIKLNNELVITLMAKKFLRPTDLADVLKVSKQMANYIIHHGGMVYADRLAKILNVKRTDLLVSSPARVPILRGGVVLNGRVRKTKERRK